METIRLELANEDDFEWLRGRRPATRTLAAVADLAPREVLEIIRPLPANWLIVVDDEVCGLIGVKSEADRAADIGYGVAPSCERRGIATAAVTAVLPLLKTRGLNGVTAEISVDNPASQRVLERNGFPQVGDRTDEENGPLIPWERAL